jgi:hypothetical protein
MNLRQSICIFCLLLSGVPARRRNQLEIQSNRQRSWLTKPKARAATAPSRFRIIAPRRNWNPRRRSTPIHATATATVSSNDDTAGWRAPFRAIQESRSGQGGIHGQACFKLRSEVIRPSQVPAGPDQERETAQTDEGRLGKRRLQHRQHTGARHDQCRLQSKRLRIPTSTT